MTKKEMFSFIATVNADNMEIVEFCNHEIELLSNKKKSPSSKPSKKQMANEILKDAIVNFLMEVDKPVTMTEIVNGANFGENLSPQKVSSLVTLLKKENRVVRTLEKKTPFFSLPVEEVEEVEGEE